MNLRLLFGLGLLVETVDIEIFVLFRILEFTAGIKVFVVGER